MNILFDGQTLHTYEIKRGIGRVFISLINSLVTYHDEFNWFITLSNLKLLDFFEPSVASKLNPILTELSPSQDPLLHGDDYGYYLQNIIEKYKIGAYWNLNPLMPNVFYPSLLNQVEIYVMLHDLIPQVMADTYQPHWLPARRDDYQKRLTLISEKATHIVAISECTLNDFIHFFPESKPKISVIPHGINHCSFYPRKIKLSPFEKPYILYIGGFDPRKQIILSLSVFAELCQFSDIPEELCFVVVCDYIKDQYDLFYETATQLNISSRVYLYGEATDDEISELYANANLFFFPSLYEGFGLPVLEALASGVLTVASDIAALREIGQENMLYCLPNDISSMAKILHQAFILNEEKKQKLILQGLERAKNYHWEKTANAYIKVINKTSPSTLSGSRLRIAFLTPWFPETSGIADYAFSLIKELSDQLSITIFSNLNHQDQEINKKLDISQKLISEFEKEKEKFDLLVYQLGNNKEYHCEIYKLAKKFPGIIILHDYYLYQFIQQSFAKDDYYLYQQALNASLKHQKTTSENPLESYPMCEDIVENSLAVVVHNQWIRQQLASFTHVQVIPHGADLNLPRLTDHQQSVLRKSLNIGKEEYILGMFGFVNSTKRFTSIVQAIAKLYHKNFPIKLLIVGEIQGDEINLEGLCQRWDIPTNLFHLTGYVDDLKFVELLNLCDIYIGLRKPSMGETSGPLMKALALGKPCIVSDYQQFSQLPDNICLKIMANRFEVEHLTACLEALLKNPELRQTMGQNAEDYIRQYSSYEKAASQYLALFNKVYLSK